MVERTLHVTADDLGLTEESSENILAAVDRGAVTSVSILPNGYAFQRAVEACKNRPTLRVAVHLNLTEGAPVSRPEDVPHLVDATGSFRRSAASLWAAYLFGSSETRQQLRREVTRELSAQIDKVRRALYPAGAKVNVDGHQHAHMIPFVFDAICSIQGIKEVRIPDEPLYFAPGPYSLRKILAVLALGYLAPGARAKAMRVGIDTNDAFVGLLFSGGMTATRTRAALSAVAKNNPQVSEIAFHPGFIRKDDLRCWKGDRAWHYCSSRLMEQSFLLTDEANSLFTAFRLGVMRKFGEFGKKKTAGAPYDCGGIPALRSTDLE